MRFKTETSEYEITSDSSGVMTLEKISISPEKHSIVAPGQKFHAKCDDVGLVNYTHNELILYFGDMHTSVITDFAELLDWLREHKVKDI
jgi:hypothetical protein